jgi:hypothetical protein
MDDVTELYVLLVEDRHTGADAWVYSTLERANAELEEWVHSAASHEEYIEWHDEPSPDGSCIRSVTYSCEDDRAAIIRRTLDEATT